jgi:hypothetical protein
MKNNDKKEIIINDTQYSLLNTRRDSYNNLLWNTPIISLTALSFLFTIIFSPNAEKIDSLIISILAFFVSIFSMQLLSKHRFYEKKIAEILSNNEKKNKETLGAINKKLINRANIFTKKSSYMLCLVLLLCFALSSLYKIVRIICEIF